MGCEAGSTKDDFDDYFYTSIYTLIRDKQSQLITDPASNQPAPQVSVSPQISPNIASYLHWVRVKLSTIDCASSLYECGEKLIQLKEKKAGETFFAACISTIDEAVSENSDPKLYFDTLKYKVQSLYGLANNDIMSAFEGDCYVKYPNTLKKLLQSLKKIQSGMELVINMKDTTEREKYSWLILNGTRHLYATCDPLMTLGYSRQVVEFFTWR